MNDENKKEPHLDVCSHKNNGMSVALPLLCAAISMSASGLLNADEMTNFGIEPTAEDKASDTSVKSVDESQTTDDMNISEDKSEAADAGGKSEKKGKKERQKDVRMPFFTAAIKAGLVFYGDVDIEAKDDKGVEHKYKITERTGFMFKLHLNLLGDGLALEVNPFLSPEWTGDDPQDGGVEKISAVGVQLGIAYRFRIRRFYPKIGVGGHLAYLGGDDIKRGIEAYGRLPVGFSIYIFRFMALVLEVAWMSGVTGIRTVGMGVFDNRIRYDYTSGVETVIGIRFP